jgi:hypothetical protein
MLNGKIKMLNGRIKMLNGRIKMLNEYSPHSPDGVAILRPLDVILA